MFGIDLFRRFAVRYPLYVDTLFFYEGKLFLLLKRLAITVLAVSMVGCGSLSTVGKDDFAVRSNLVRNKTRCETVSHIYSGVAYDFCRLNSINDGVADDLYGSVLLGFFISDMAPSLVVDTLALPYTGYQEHRLGSIAIRGD